jgi:hypothetical protein
MPPELSKMKPVDVVCIAYVFATRDNLLEKARVADKLYQQQIDVSETLKWRSRMAWEDFHEVNQKLILVARAIARRATAELSGGSSSPSPLESGMSTFK